MTPSGADLAVAAPYAAAADTSRLSVSLLRSVEAAEALAEEWRALEERSPQPTFFQSPAFIAEAARHFAAAGHFSPLFAVVRDGAEMVAFAPLKLVRSGPLRIAVDLGAPFGQYGGMLAAGPVEPAEAVAAILKALSKAGIDGLLLRKVREDAPDREALLEHGFPVGRGDAAPYVDLSPFESFEAYHKSVNAKTRKNIRNARNRAARLAELHHKVFPSGELAQAIGASFEGRLAWLNEQGLTSTAFADPGFRPFVERLAAAAEAGRIRILAMGLYAGDTAIALQWGFVHRDRYYAFLSAKNPAFDAISPGKIHLEDVLRTVKGEDIAVADFLAPNVPYKLTWTRTVCAIGDIAVPLSWKGRLFLTGWHKVVRPALARSFFALPAPIRQRVNRLLRRHAEAEKASDAEAGEAET